MVVFQSVTDRGLIAGVRCPAFQVLKLPNPGIENIKLKHFEWKRQRGRVASLHQTDGIRKRMD